MEKGDRYLTDKKVVLVFEKYDKDGDALFTSPTVDFNDIKYTDEELKGYFVLPVHMIPMIMKKIDD